MVNLVELKFSLICEADEDCCNEIGEDICHDMCRMYHNGEDTYEWQFHGFEVLKEDYNGEDVFEYLF